jgi:hypothetical protein
MFGVTAALDDPPDHVRSCLESVRPREEPIPALKNRVWLSVGTDEDPEFTQSARDFFKQFKASNFEGIALRFYEVPGERHAGLAAQRSMTKR